MKESTERILFKISEQIEKIPEKTAYLKPAIDTPSQISAFTALAPKMESIDLKIALAKFLRCLS